MDFELTEEQRLFQETAQQVAEKEITPIAERVDESGQFPRETIAQLGELGFMGVAVPQEYGGAGADTVCYVLALEEISRACASHGVIMSVNNSLYCEPVLRFGMEEQKRRFLAPVASGKSMGCFCLSEPGAGSDAANQQTTARREGDWYVLNGTKNFITNGNEADYAIVFATVNKALKHKGICAFAVERGTPGFTVAHLEKKLGIRGSSCAQLTFDNCRVSAENLLGKEGEGFKIALATLDGGRIGIAAQAVGIARAALEASRDYSKQRIQFGKPIAANQAIQFMLADMATEIDAARLLTLNAALLKDRGLRHTKESSMAKLYASEVAMRASIKGVQIFGGYGYMMDYPAQRFMRDAKITEIYEGTSEVQRMVIASALLS
ncbi:MAG: acyl-CoA dehydrogenase [candidate division NC10 bacterium RIFCSPLOWO2_12_FULL_66_18]|nr:MAG: acyl-CoA dehydrogenase [candidate division NC10 bacterium RIFCSPLOWO2_12_FULL_66_18]